jgi:hypothetical protein
VVFERQRRERLEQALDALSPHTRSRLVKVIGADRPAEALGLLNTRFGRLPPGVTLTPRSLQVDLRGEKSFSRASARSSSRSKMTPSGYSRSWSRERAMTKTTGRADEAAHRADSAERHSRPARFRRGCCPARVQPATLFKKA